MGEIIEPLQNYRNKRFAHMEYFHLKPTELNLIDLAAALTDLDNSINFITHYVLNAHLLHTLTEVKDRPYFAVVDSERSIAALERQLKNDRIIRVLDQIEFFAVKVQ